MAWYEVLVISIGLTLDVFAYALYKGAMVSGFRAGKVCRMLIIFILWENGAMLLGSMISQIPSIEDGYRKMERVCNVYPAVIFFGVGVLMLYKSMRQGTVLERREDDFNPAKLCAWAAITSLDSFLAGIGLGFLNTRLPLMLVQLAAVTAAGILAGLYMGYRMGCGQRGRALAVGGGIFLAAGLDVMVRYYR